MLSAQEIATLHDEMTRAWHENPASRYDKLPTSAAEGAVNIEANEQAEWLGQVERQHRANFNLWHIEDEARRPGASDADLAAVKRRVDPTNQTRNDLAEELDRALLKWLGDRGLPNPTAALHSETPGLIIDRLSILALKIYHTREEAERADGPEGHRERNRERLAVLLQQRGDLADCLDALWRDTLTGSRRFKLYRQLKMYNDPSLNPAMYRKASVKQDVKSTSTRVPH